MARVRTFWGRDGLTPVTAESLRFSSVVDEGHSGLICATLERSVIYQGRQGDELNNGLWRSW